MKKMLFAVFSAAILGFSALVNAKTIEFTDVVGHKIKLEAPAKRIAIGAYYTEFMAVGGDFKNVVGFAKYVFSEWNSNLWNEYIKVMPELDKIPNIADAGGSITSVENVITLNPDVLVVAKFQYDKLTEGLKALESSGIPVVVVDYHSGDFHRKSTEILGKITGNEKRADEIMNEYEGILKKINDRTKNLKKKTTAYIEYGYNGAKDNGGTYSHFMWGDLIDKAGVDNIANGLVKHHGSINPETILMKDPDIIIIAGREHEVKKGETMIMGVGIDFKDANERLKTFTARPSWDSLKAVQNGRIFAGSHGMLRNLGDIFMIEYIAKAAYPDLFKDLDPRADWVKFNQKYLPVTPNGTFMLKIDDEKF